MSGTFTKVTYVLAADVISSLLILLNYSIDLDLSFVLVLKFPIPLLLKVGQYQTTFLLDLDGTLVTTDDTYVKVFFLPC